MNTNAYSIIELLITSDLDADEPGNPKSLTSYALTNAVRLIEELGDKVDVPFCRPSSDDEGGIYLSWDCPRANVSVHIFATSYGGQIKVWDENDDKYKYVSSKDYVYYDFTDESGLTSIDCGAVENIDAENVASYLERFMELCQD